MFRGLTFGFIGKFTKDGNNNMKIGDVKKFCIENDGNIMRTISTKTNFVIIPKNWKTTFFIKSPPKQLKKIHSNTKIVKIGWLVECKKNKRKINYSPYRVDNDDMISSILHSTNNNDLTTTTTSLNIHPFYLRVITPETQCLSEQIDLKNRVYYNDIFTGKSFRYPPNGYKRRLFGGVSIINKKMFSGPRRIEKIKQFKKKLERTKDMLSSYIKCVQMKSQNH